MENEENQENANESSKKATEDNIQKSSHKRKSGDILESVTQVDSNKPATATSAAPGVILESASSDSDDGVPKLAQETTTGSDTAAARSNMWVHFTRTIEKGKIKGKCNHCGKLYVAGGRNGTASLHKHYKKCFIGKRCDGQQTLLLAKNMNVNDPTLILGRSEVNQDEGRKFLAYMIILHEYPLSMVDHYGFRKFLEVVSPTFKVVSRNTIKSDMMKIYDFEKEKTMKLFNKNRGRIAITCDMWTANHQNKGYLTITSHFVDNSWKLQSRLLRFVYVPSPHTKEVLAEVLKESFFNWNIDRKLSTLTVDNCTTNDAIVEEIKSKLPSGWLLLRGSLFHMRCCAHILNLIVQDGLSVIGEGIGRIRESVAYWTASPKREQRFNDAASQCNIDSSKKISLDCKTRWNSTYLMLETALVYRDVFFRLSVVEKGYKCHPTGEQWEFTKEICGSLELFYNATLKFSGTKYPTTNIFFPTICEIKLKLNELFICGNYVVENMAKQMIEKFDKYWNVIHNVMGVAIVLDPRFKIKLCEYFYPQIYGKDGAKCEIERIKEICYDLLSEYQEKQENQVQPSSLPDSTPAQLDTSKILRGYDMFIQEEEDCSSGKSELDNYLNEKVLPRTSEDFDVLAWWKTNGPKYPTLQMIARDILAIPITTVASESSFSTSGRVISPHRNRLHSNTIEALMCTQNWLWADIKDPSSTSTSDPQYFTILEDIDASEES